MAETVSVVRKWGNSIGITIPADIAEEEHIRPNDKVIIKVKKVVPIAELFGTFKTKRSGQSLKDEMRAGWD